jgi:hypothetical protein
MSKKKDLKRELKRRDGFSTSTPRSTFPFYLLERANNISEREAEEDRKKERREKRRTRREKDGVILTIRGRRQWLHRLRMNANQDKALMDYRVIDKELNLDWEYLIAERE